MNSLIKMAWRNIWRNKKRTIITMCSIILAIFLSLFTRSMQKGTYGSMINNAVKMSTGFIQIQKDGYWENKTINETFELSDSISSCLIDENISIYLQRLESFALASSGTYTKGAMVIGTIPEKEDQLNNYSSRIIKGEYISSDERGINIGAELADYLNVNVGDSLVLLSQGYRGVTAASQYVIKGILRLPIPQFNKRLVLMHLSECQYFYNSENRLTSISIMLNNPEDLDITISKIHNNLPNDLAAMSWEKMNKELVQFVESKIVGGKIMLSILYIVIGFGVFGTMMMMTMERRKEFAVMVSIGMQKLKLLYLVFTETIFIGMVALLIGVSISFPLLLYLSYNPIQLKGEFAKSMELVGAEPIMPFIINSEIFLNQSISIILIVFIAIIYPLIFILKFDVLKAIRN